ncbi:peptidyl-prolyl cis-trans isomerase [Paenibacillus sp. GD4]|uniref:peptidyl-prolyl cis-trans isomerase n=1 Tax=Paenibacillus sp. GD4 TaxID=3068890 RepID=UPI002796D17A|nr:peptidyl-prolyl cis-trans isomerase [Paenibacillus sp. GD4]MDQ1910923.1 peptidyl-prolyl cis-trans isomerase [Paenibacillus sp. GD4]
MQNRTIVWGIIAVLLIAVIVLSSVLLYNSYKQPAADMKPDQRQPEGNTRTIATIGNQTITLRQLEEQLLNKYGREQLNQIIDHEVIRLEANAQGISVQEKEVQQELKRMQQGYESESRFYEAMKEQLGLTPEAIQQDITYRLLVEKLTIRGVTITNEEVDAYLAAHQDEFKPNIRLRLQQIVVSNREQAAKVLNDAAKGIPFEQIAKERSLDDFTRDAGGDLGWVEADDPFVPGALMKIAKGMKAGEISKPIEESGQLYILKVKERKETSKGSPEEIRERIRKELALREAPPMQEMIKELRKKWNVSVTL